MGFALSPDPDADPGDDPCRATTSGALRYGHFEISVGPDGHPIELGAGAMAVTYRARDTILDRPVALKVIDQTLADHAAARSRFLREARAAAQLHHANVASVTHYGEQDGECYYAMELVEGETLEQRVRRDGPLSPDVTLEIAVQVARALAAAETCGVVHRDLKPSNIMIASDGSERGGDSVSVKVIDYGLAKAMAAESPLGLDQTRGAFVGTPGFASPEQFARNGDDRIDLRSDIYSLGVTIWYLLTGRVPFVAGSLDEIHSRQIEAKLPLEQLAAAKTPECLREMLKSMLAVDLNARPQSARELLTALRRCQQPAVSLEAVREARRSWRKIATAAALFTAVVLAAVWWSRGLNPAQASDRSVAILPFENRNLTGDDAFFTVGVQEEIGTAIGSFGSLKVIGSRSTQAYREKSRELAKIGRELSVGHVVEGSVWRGEGRIQVSARLVQCATGAVVWAAEFERPLEDVFAVKGEIVAAVAERLGVRLSASQRAALAAAPTRDMQAYDLLLRSRQVPRSAATFVGMRRFLTRRIALTEEAIARDPSFALAYCELARVCAAFYSIRAGATQEELAPDHAARAEAALQKARAINPDNGELHLTESYFHLKVSQDLNAALAAANRARAHLPNQPEVEEIAGSVALTQGRWDDALRALERARLLTPNRIVYRIELAQTYRLLRRFGEYEAVVAEMIRNCGGDPGTLIFNAANGALDSRGDTRLLREAFAEFDARKDLKATDRDELSILFALDDRDPDALDRALAASTQPRLHSWGTPFPKAWYAALACKMRGDNAGLQRALTEARADVEQSLAAEPKNGRALSLLALIDAGLGHVDEAVNAAQRAIELSASSAQDAPVAKCYLAAVYAWTGQADLAFATLESLVRQPAGRAEPSQPSYGDFRLNPIWDPLRSDPRFTALQRQLTQPAADR